MPNSSASLDRLPTELLSHIAGHVSEKEIWMMMGTCNSLRRVMEGELKRYLEERVIGVNDPAILNDRYGVVRVDTCSGMDDTQRQKLRDLTGIFGRHLTAYPAATLELRKLIIEADANVFSAGWEQAVQAGRFLPELEIRVENSAWQSKPSRRMSHAASPPAKIPQHLLDHIRRDAKSSPFFPDLTAFTLTTTSDPLHLFAELGRHMPRLRNLSLKSQYETRRTRSLPFDGIGSIAELPHLERICINTPLVDTYRVLTELRPVSPRLRSIIMVGSRYTATVNMKLAVRIAQSYPLLAHLALYREWHLHAFPEPADQKSFARLTTLVLDRCPSRSSYPILDLAGIVRPSLPSLRLITWIDRSTDPMGDEPWIESMVTDNLESADDPRLRSLFDQYTTLEQVYCLSDFPADPFAEVDTANTDSSVLFYASRSDVCG